MCGHVGSPPPPQQTHQAAQERGQHQHQGCCCRNDPGVGEDGIRAGRSCARRRSGFCRGRLRGLAGFFRGGRLRRSVLRCGSRRRRRLRVVRRRLVDGGPLRDGRSVLGDRSVRLAFTRRGFETQPAVVREVQFRPGVGVALPHHPMPGADALPRGVPDGDPRGNPHVPGHDRHR